MGRLGFEPRTIRLKAEYSTVELATRLLQFIFATFATVTQVFAVMQVFRGNLPQAAPVTAKYH